jgi:DNA-binding MarR family transcriptional regulator
MAAIDPACLGAWRALLTAHARLVDRLGGELEREAGIPFGWYEVLLRLSRAEGHRLRMHVLAESLLSSRSAATRYIDRMERAGLVVRMECDADHRGTFVALTDRGGEVFRRAGPLHLRGIATHFADLIGPEEADVIQAALERVARQLEDQPGG